MAIYRAKVDAQDGWVSGKQAKVTIKEGNLNLNTILTIEGRDTSHGQTIITRGEYEPGIVRMNNQNIPSTPKVDLDATVTSGNDATSNDWPNSVVVFI
jgi:hypothetical protein